MAKQQLSLNNFTGAISNDYKVGTPNSYLFSRNIDVFQDASYMTPYPRAVKVSGSTVIDQVLWAVDGSPFDTNRYFYGREGNFYSEDAGGVWTNLRTVTDSLGNGLGVLNDYIYYAGDITLGRYGPLSLGSPTFNDNFLADGITDLDQSGSGTGNTYTPPVAISEASTDKQPFTPNYDPVGSISIYVTSKGTGNWTVTLHDSQDNEIAATTLSNVSLVNASLNTFTLNDARVVIGNEYHFHVTSTVADGTMKVGTSADLSTSTFNEYFGILINAQYHTLS